LRLEDVRRQRAALGLEPDVLERLPPLIEHERIDEEHGPRPRRSSATSIARRERSTTMSSYTDAIGRVMSGAFDGASDEERARAVR
jgi:hypothetical protein